MVSCLGSLVHSCCGEGGALQTNVTGACGEQAQCSGHTGFVPAHGCVLSPSTLLRLLAALYGVGPALCVVPVFGSSIKAQTRLGLRFVPFPARAAQAARSLTGTLSPGALRLLPCAVPASVSGWVPVGCALCLFWGSWSLAATLPADVNHPESQEVFG